MKKVAFAIFLIVSFGLIPRVCAQENIGAGGLVSAAYYMGDFNPGVPFYKPSLYVGGIVTYKFSDYYGLRMNVGGGRLRGEPTTYDGFLMSNEPQQERTAFDTYFFDVDARFEVGFLPYDPFASDPKRYSFSPYFSLGAGLGYTKENLYLQLPVSFGIKYRLLYRLTVGVEWAFHKTFSDKIDGWENIRTSGWTVNNNDWISYVGIYFTYQLADKMLCPALR